MALTGCPALGRVQVRLGARFKEDSEAGRDLPSGRTAQRWLRWGHGPHSLKRAHIQVGSSRLWEDEEGALGSSRMQQRVGWLPLGGLCWTPMLYTSRAREWSGQASASLTSLGAPQDQVLWSPYPHHIAEFLHPCHICLLSTCYVPGSAGQ